MVGKTTQSFPFGSKGLFFSDFPHLDAHLVVKICGCVNHPQGHAHARLYCVGEPERWREIQVGIWKFPKITQQLLAFLLKMTILGCFGGTIILGNIHISYDQSSLRIESFNWVGEPKICISGDQASARRESLFFFVVMATTTFKLQTINKINSRNKTGGRTGTTTTPVLFKRRFNGNSHDFFCSRKCPPVSTGKHFLRTLLSYLTYWNSKTYLPNHTWGDRFVVHWNFKTKFFATSACSTVEFQEKR